MKTLYTIDIICPDVLSPLDFTASSIYCKCHCKECKKAIDAHKAPGTFSKDSEGSWIWFSPWHLFLPFSISLDTALWEDLGKQADIILHNHLQPPPWPPSCPLPHLPLCFCLLSDSLSHWEKQSLQLADAIVLLLLLIRLISLFELGASGPSPILGELPPSLLFITICSMKCDLLSNVSFVFFLR